ncbi:MAG: 5'-3' exonuclease H3TH domain-containing protein [Lysobacteraceae bacterium]
MTRATLHLVDSSLYVFRAWHSYPDDVRDAEGQPANAVHGFIRFALELLERERPTHIVFAFDESLDSSFRNERYPAYKANREPAPEELKRQFAGCRALLDALGITTLADPRFEADDLIGSALKQARGLGMRGLIVSADKDLSQLLQADDEQWDYARQTRWNAAGVLDRHGVHAHQIADYLGLAGDAVDNIPGVPGIGSKTAAALLAHFGSLDALLQRLDEVPFLRIRGAASHARRIQEHRDNALLSRELATICCEATLPAPLALRPARVDSSRLQALCEQFRIGPLTRRRLNEWSSASLA